MKGGGGSEFCCTRHEATCFVFPPSDSGEYLWAYSTPVRKRATGEFSGTARRPTVSPVNIWPATSSGGLLGGGERGSGACACRGEGADHD